MPELILATSQDDNLGSLLAAPSPLGFGDRVHFDHARQRWLIWNGVRWRPDTSREVYNMIRLHLNAWWMASDETVQPETGGSPEQEMCALMTDAGWFKLGRGEFRKIVMSLLGTAKKESVLKGLSARRGIAMSGHEWDTDPYLVGFDNGIVDLRTGQFFEQPDPQLLVSKTVGCDWPSEPVTWPEDRGFGWFLNDIFEGDEDLVDYMFRLIGYSLLGLQSEQKFWMWVGRGSNGKGVLARVITDAFGDYADTPSDSLYMRTKFGTAPSSQARPDLVRLQGVRFTFMSEPPGQQFNEELLKAHTGEDTVLARDLYGKADSMLKFTPTHKIVFLTNDPPKTDDVGVSMRRRVRVVRFNHDYSANPDLKLEEHLKTQKQVIVVKAVREAVRWLVEGLPEPAKVTAWSEEYITDNDPLAAFITERCEVRSGIVGTSVLLWQAYLAWCGSAHVEPVTQTAFGRALASKFTRKHQRTGALYEGIRAKSAMEMLPGAENADQD